MQHVGPNMTRRCVMRGAVTIVGLGLQKFTSELAFAETADPISRDAVLRDPAAPVLGNPDGNLTIVEYYDYQCPYCRKFQPLLAKTVEDDGKIRLVAKDWPIFGANSLYASRMALAAQFQNKYATAHAALMAAERSLVPQITDEILVKAGIDVQRATSDLVTHRAAIDGLLQRNDMQAKALGFSGTPAFIVGKFRVPGILEAPTFRQVIADARAQAANR